MDTRTKSLCSLIHWSYWLMCNTKVIQLNKFSIFSYMGFDFVLSTEIFFLCREILFLLVFIPLQFVQFISDWNPYTNPQKAIGYCRLNFHFIFDYRMQFGMFTGSAFICILFGTIGNDNTRLLLFFEEHQIFKYASMRYVQFNQISLQKNTIHLLHGIYMKKALKSSFFACFFHMQR